MLKSTLRIIPAALAAGLGVAALVFAQAPTGANAPGKAVVTGTGSFTSFVENMDRSLAFYHDAFGMDVPALPATGERAYNAPNPGLNKFFDIDGAKERHQSARTGRVTVEFMEVQQVPFKTIPLRMQDPGNATIIFIVRDLDAALARATQAKAVVATPGGKPVALADGRSILIKDIDGRFIELRQPNVLPTPAPAPAGGKGKAPAAAAPPSPADVLDMQVAITVKDLGDTLKSYRDVLGFKVEGETKFTADAAMRSLTGLTKAEVRRARVQAPGSQLWIEFVEYKGVDRKPLVMKIQDRGAARIQLRVSDTEGIVAAMKAAGWKVHSTDGVVQPIPPNLKAALVADANNFFWTPYAPCDGCSPMPAKK